MRQLLALVTLIALAPALSLGEASASEPTVAVQTSGRGNVRYGPDLKAGVITTLDAGVTVQVYGPAPGKEGWYTIAFPRQGHAWVHDSVLQATDDPNWFRVTTDGANVRSDSRINADLVTQLAFGEMVEFKGRKVGRWLAIHPGSGKAYIYESVLSISPQLKEAIHGLALRNDENERRWALAKLRYEHYRTNFEADTTSALQHDWAGLDAELASVEADHPAIRTRLLAQKLRRGIERVVRASNEYLRKHNLQPLADPEFQLPEPDLPAQPQPQPQPQPRDQQPQPQPQPRDPQPQPQPHDPPPLPPVDDPVTADPGGLTTRELSTVGPAAPVAGSESMIGWLEQRDDPGIGTSYVLLGQGSEVVAYLSVRPGADIRLSEFFWRRVAVTGSTTPAEISTPAGTTKILPLIQVSEIRLAD